MEKQPHINDNTTAIILLIVSAQIEHFAVNHPDEHPYMSVEQVAYSVSSGSGTCQLFPTRLCACGSPLTSVPLAIVRSFMWWLLKQQKGIHFDTSAYIYKLHSVVKLFR